MRPPQATGFRGSKIEISSEKDTEFIFATMLSY